MAWKQKLIVWKVNIVHSSNHGLNYRLQNANLFQVIQANISWAYLSGEKVVKLLVVQLDESDSDGEIVIGHRRYFAENFSDSSRDHSLHLQRGRLVAAGPHGVGFAGPGLAVGKNCHVETWKSYFLISLIVFQTWFFLNANWIFCKDLNARTKKIRLNEKVTNVFNIFF